MGLPVTQTVSSLGGYKLSTRAAVAQQRYDAPRAAKSVEGEYREGPYDLPITGGWLSPEAGRNLNFWQMGYDVQSPRGSAMVEACVSAYAQTIAMCPGNHWRRAEGEGRVRVPNSALVRLIKKPNAYQTISDFLLNAVRGLLLEGNAYALALRNDRYEITELHLMDPRTSFAQVAYDGSVFYHLSGNEVIDRQIGAGFTVPARDVLHLRLHTPRHTLVGETPLAAAGLQIAAGNAALTQQINFFLNQSRPSFVLTTEQVLKKEQVEMLREAWNEQSRGLNQGSTPILTAGLKATPIGAKATDSQLVDMLKLSDKAIASVYRVPPAIVGEEAKAVASTETLMQFWLASGLGFVLNHIEEAIGLFFKLGGQPDEYLEFDTSALQRSSFKERVEGWAAGTKGGIFDRNTARADFEMGPVDGGSEPWVQQQDIPLSVAARAAKEPSVPPVPPEPVALPVEAPEDQARRYEALRQKEASQIYG